MDDSAIWFFFGFVILIAILEQLGPLYPVTAYMCIGFTIAIYAFIGIISRITETSELMKPDVGSLLLLMSPEPGHGVDWGRFAAWWSSATARREAVK